MILVDASILIRHMRTADPVIGAALQRPDMGVAGLTRAEILQGARSATDVPRLVGALDVMIQVSTPEAVWSDLGLNLATLRRAGITVPFQDALLATIAIHHGAELWSADAHFGMMQGVLPAPRLFVPPPAPPSPGPVTP